MMENITSTVVRANRGGRPRGGRTRCLTVHGDRTRRAARAMSLARAASLVKQADVFRAAKPHVHVTPVFDPSKQSGCGLLTFGYTRMHTSRLRR